MKLKTKKVKENSDKSLFKRFLLMLVKEPTEEDFYAQREILIRQSEEDTFVEFCDAKPIFF